MKNITTYTALFLFSVLCIVSCQPDEDTTISEEVIVNLYGKTLSKNDIKAIIPDGISTEDSIAMAKKYIQQWINKELLYRHAANNLKDSSKIKKKVKDFKKQMYVYELENQYIDSKLDTMVSYDEIEAYHKKHLSSYILDKVAVKAHYMIMDADVSSYYKELDKVRRAKPGNMDILYDAVKRTNKTIIEHNQKWIYFDELLQEISAKRNAEVEQGLKKGYFAVEDSVNRYIVKINDVIMPGDTMPVDLIENKISHIIINKRKKELLTDLKNQLLQDAKTNGNLVINEN